MGINCHFELLTKYVRIIGLIERARGCSTEVYTTLDKERRKIHRQILEHCNKDENDKNFQLELAMFIEEMLGH